MVCCIRARELEEVTDRTDNTVLTQGFSAATLVKALVSVLQVVLSVSRCNRLGKAVQMSTNMEFCLDSNQQIQKSYVAATVEAVQYLRRPTRQLVFLNKA